MRLARLMIPFAELSIVGSYGRSGYRLRSPDFDPADLAVGQADFYAVRVIR